MRGKSLETHGQEQVNAKQRRRLRCNLTFGVRIFQSIDPSLINLEIQKGERTV
jgi:hypothetical protein